MAPNPVPNQMISANFGGVYGLLYTDINGYILWMKGPVPDVAGSKYEIKSAIQVGGRQNAEAVTGKVAIAGWNGKNNAGKDVRELRLYYIAKNNNQVKELCMTADPSKSVETFQWYEGNSGNPTFNAESFIADPNSPLTASAVNGSIRVYFKRKIEKQLTCAYNLATPEQVPGLPGKPPTTKYWKTFVVATEDDGF